MKSIKDYVGRREAERLDFPDCWEEVDGKEWVHLLWLRQQLAERKNLTLDDIRQAWCAFVLQNRGLKNNHPGFWLLVRELAGTLEWMWRTEKNGDTTVVSLTFDSTVNLLPCAAGLTGPASHGADLTFGEFRAATAALSLYDRSHEGTDLLALCAILYRPAKKQKGLFRREPFDAERLPVLMARARILQPYLQWGIYAWFASFCRYLYTGTFLIDGQEVCFAPIFDRTKRTADPPSEGLGLNSILYSVASSGVFGTATDTDNTLLLRVMMKLLDDKHQADRLLEKTKKNQ